MTTVSGLDGTDTLFGIERLQSDHAVLTAGSPGSEEAAVMWIDPVTAVPPATEWVF
ncbi:MAG: hypothetical protein KY449_11210 [Proteobacteria bacterium]|nr:hypothetical protein [Pseudomonadota bacterium]